MRTASIRVGELTKVLDGLEAQTPILNRIELLQQQRAAKAQFLAEFEAELGFILGELKRSDLAQINTGRPLSERAALERKATLLLDSIQGIKEDLPLLNDAIHQWGEAAAPEILLRAKALCATDRQWELTLIHQLSKAWNEVHRLVRDFKSRRHAHDEQMKQLEAQLRIFNLNPQTISAKALSFERIHLRELSWYLKRCLDVTFSNPLHANEELGKFDPRVPLSRDSKDKISTPS